MLFRSLLVSAITNLVDNAFKYAGAGSTIKLEVGTKRGQACVSVKDDGPGVPDTQLAKLGSRFHRLDQSIPGFGLGLASVRAVVALHGGQVEFLNARPGLQVDILLPIITKR